MQIEKIGDDALAVRARKGKRQAQRVSGYPGPTREGGEADATLPDLRFDVFGVPVGRHDGEPITVDVLPSCLPIISTSTNDFVMMGQSWTIEAAKRLKRLVAEVMTQPQLAEATGIPIATLQRILAGKSDPGDRLDRIVEAIGTSAEHVFEGDAAPSRDGRVPLYDIEVAAGAGRFSLNHARPVDHWPFPTAWLGQFGAAADLKLVTVAGDSQEPELSDGDMVMIDTASTRLRDGLHVVRLDDALLLKRVQLQGGTVLLKSANAAYGDIAVDLARDQDQFEVIGQAVWAGKLL